MSRRRHWVAIAKQNFMEVSNGHTIKRLSKPLLEQSIAMFLKLALGSFDDCLSILRLQRSLRVSRNRSGEPLSIACRQIVISVCVCVCVCVRACVRVQK